MAGPADRHGAHKSRRLPDPGDHFPGNPVSLERPARLS